MKEAPLTSSVSGTSENRRMTALKHRPDSNQQATRQRCTLAIEAGWTPKKSISGKGGATP
jgi:hypothetical protein